MKIHLYFTDTAPAVKRDDVVLSRDQTLQYLRNFTGCDGCGMEKRLQDGRWLHFHTDDELCAEEDVLSAPAYTEPGQQEHSAILAEIVGHEV